MTQENKHELIAGYCGKYDTLVQQFNENAMDHILESNGIEAWIKLLIEMLKNNENSHAQYTAIIVLIGLVFVSNHGKHIQLNQHRNTNMQTEDILKAYIDKHGTHPQKVQQLISFSKESKQVTNLKYSQARKILAYSKSKSTKNGRNGRLSIKHKKKRKNDKSTCKKQNQSKPKSPPINIDRNNKLIATSTTALTPYIDVIDSADDITKLDLKTKKKKSKNKNKNKNSKPKTKNKNKYDIGDNVKLSQDREGIIRYIGTVSFTTGIMFGIELLNGAVGKHDGKFENKRYFTAPKHRGIFVRESRIQRKIRKNERESSFTLNRKASLKTKELNTKKWTPPFPTSSNRVKDMEFKSEHTYIHHSSKYNNNNNDSIDDTSMSIVYRVASLNLHRHILQKVSNTKKQKHLDIIKDNAFSAHNKLHSPMIPIRIAPMSPILTFENISTQTMKSVQQKLMLKKKKRRSVIIHRRPSITKTFNEITTIPKENSKKSHAKNPFNFSEEDEEKFSINANANTIGFSSRNYYNMMSPATPAMTSIPPLTQITIDYIEMEGKINNLIEILINKTDRITNEKDINNIYEKCDINKNDLEQELYGWIDLLCTHQKLFHKTKLIKNVNEINAFFVLRDDDKREFNDISESEESENEKDENESNERDKEKEALRAHNRKQFRNNMDYFNENETYYYTVFERLLFELNLFYLYFIYDIGFDNSNAFNEKHPSNLFLLCGNITQILKKCSPVLNCDINKFYNEILYPYHLKIRYKYINNESKYNIKSMTKYGREYGIRNEYNFVARIQYEEMFDGNDRNIVNNDIFDENNITEQVRHNNLEYELIIYNKKDTNGIVIYKSLIPSVFAINNELKITTLKRTIIVSYLILKSQCHFECEKWNEEGDYYGFIRIKIINDLIINKESIITANECGYYNKKGFGIGAYFNDFENKTKYYSGASYGTKAETPHEECPSGECYGNDCIENNYLYYGSPCFDDNERGGGIIDILCGNLFINYGNIQCNGANGMQFGGSSGGSIKIVCKYFINYGNINANGGNGAVYQRKGSKRKQIGTKGGDGRIFIYCFKYINKGIISPEPTIINIKCGEINKYSFSHIKSLGECTTF